MRRLPLFLITLLIFSSATFSAADEPSRLQRTAWSFDRSALQWNDDADRNTDKAKGELNASGWIEYDFDLDKSSWYELWLNGMNGGWMHDVFIDGHVAFDLSSAQTEDNDKSVKSRFKEGNLYLSSGKHTLRLRRLENPGQFPKGWELIPSDGRAEASIAVDRVADQMTTPDVPFQIDLRGGGEKPLEYQLVFKSVMDDKQIDLGSVKFPAGGQPTVVKLTPTAPEGVYLLMAKQGSQMLRPADLKSLPFVVSRAAVEHENKRPVPTALGVSHVFSSGMVVQRDVPLPVWGYAPPKAEVQVAFAGQTKSGTADADGRWRVTFAPTAAGGPYTLEAAAGPDKVTFDDILVGEVWLLSGQSNMGGRLREITNGPKTAEAAKFPDVRLGWAAINPSEASPDPINCNWQPAAVTPKHTLDNLLAFNGIAYGFGTDLHQKLNIPIGMVINNRGGTFISTWANVSTMEKEPAFKPNFAPWPDSMYLRRVHQRTAASMPGAIRQARKATSQPTVDLDQIVKTQIMNQSRNLPGMNFDQLVAPLGPFAFKGVVWYQGESDTPVAPNYPTMFKSLMADWRQVLKNENLHFIVVQIAYGEGKPTTSPPGDSRFGEMQEAQASTQAFGKVSVVTTYDLPTPTDNVHYLNKIPVGQRAALAAMKDVYGLDVVATGPRYASMKVDGSTIRLRFTDTGGGLVCHGDNLGGFAVAGEDQVFTWADAVIVGDEVVVSAKGVPHPVAVRYAWSNRPCGGNLYGGTGLPALVFRTDNWPVSALTRLKMLSE